MYSWPHSEFIVCCLTPCPYMGFWCTSVGPWRFGLFVSGLCLFYEARGGSNDKRQKRRMLCFNKILKRRLRWYNFNSPALPDHQRTSGSKGVGGSSPCPPPPIKIHSSRDRSDSPDLSPAEKASLFIYFDKHITACVT